MNIHNCSCTPNLEKLLLLLRVFVWVKYFFDDFWDPVFSLLSSGDEIPLRRALDGELVDIEGGGARVHRLHHVVPQVLAHLQANYMTKECKDPYTM